MKKIRAANLTIEMEYSSADFFDDRLRKYEVWDSAAPDMSLKTRYLDEIPAPAGDVIGEVFNTTIVRIANGRLCRYLCDNETGRIAVAIYYDDAYADVEICLNQHMSQTALSLTELEYMYTGHAFGDRITELGGVVVHGSSVSYRNQGILFSANSGTGKSTHAALWKKVFGDDAVIINDDKPAIRCYNNVPYLYGTPWSGKTDLNENMHTELKVIVFLQQAADNTIERLTVRDSIFSLMSQISRPYYDENIGLKTMPIIEKLVQTVPVYRLSCNISSQAVETAYRKLKLEGVIDK
jgi:hypothetical protein